MNFLLDLDGTLTDSRPGIVACIRYALERCGLQPSNDEDLQRWIGPPLKDCFSHFLGEACVSDAIAAYRERFTNAGMFENAVYEHIPAALDGLAARGARLYIATSKPRVFAERILEHFALADRFVAIFGSELDGRLCEKTDLIAHALEQANLDPAESVMIGDREHDIVGALSNALYPVGVLWGYGSEKELRNAGAKCLLTSPMQICDLPSPASVKASRVVHS